jgi:hypothetical protein
MTDQLSRIIPTYLARTMLGMPKTTFDRLVRHGFIKPAGKLIRSRGFLLADIVELIDSPPPKGSKTASRSCNYKRKDLPMVWVLAKCPKCSRWHTFWGMKGSSSRVYCVDHIDLREESPYEDDNFRVTLKRKMVHFKKGD